MAPPNGCGCSVRGISSNIPTSSPFCKEIGFSERKCLTYSFNVLLGVSMPKITTDESREKPVDERSNNNSTKTLPAVSSAGWN